MKGKKIISLMTVVALALAACGGKSTPTTAPVERSAETVQMLQKMQAIAASGSYMFGHQDDVVYGHTWNGCIGDPAFEGRSDTREVCGDYPGIIGFDLGRLELGHDKNLDGVPFDKMRREIVAQYERGGMTTLSWHLDNPLTGGDAWDYSNTGTVASILPGGEKHEEFIARMERVANFFASLVTAEGVHVPVLFRPWHEHTGSWFWWGQDICTTEQYKALWRMTYDFMQSRGLDNLLWAYGPGAEPHTLDQYFERYPGDDIVDVLGFDTYQGNDRDFYVQDLERCILLVADAAKAHGKVAAITETGYEGTPDAQWWTGTLGATIAHAAAPIAYVLVWRNAWDKPGHHYGVYPGHESEQDFLTFSERPEVLFASDVKKAK